jgi:hypothetical protein
MASIIRVTTIAVIASAGLSLAGCAGDTGAGLFAPTTTASIPEKPKVDPACITLTSEIDTLRGEGIAEKIEKAAAKKYKMTVADLSKAAQLNKANAEFKAKCSSLMTTAQGAPAVAGEVTTAGAQANQPVALAKASTQSALVSPMGENGGN